MARSVNQIQDIFLAILLILHLDSVTFNCNTSLALQIHIVKHLTFSHLNGFCALQQSIGKCRLTVINMCYYTEISDILHERIRVFTMQRY